MRGCFEPGRVIVLPNGPKFHAENVIESVVDALGESPDFRVAGPVPKLLDVEPGTEHQSCSDLLRGGSVLAASPNFYVDPSSPVKLEEPALTLLLREVDGSAPKATAGKGIRVAVLDSGWTEPNDNLNAPQVPQYFADRPPMAGVPGDSTGHGTTVVEIIRRLAPAADVRSFRIYDRTGTLWAMLSGLLLAEATFAPHLINLSLSLKCETKSCAFCKTSAISAEQLSLLFWAFRNQRTAPSPAIVAAAGNNEKRCTIPAALDGVIAVGGFDRRTGGPSPYSQYDAVPAGRFVMAPGGSKDAANAFAFSRIGMTARTDSPLYGTSFAAPCITGLAARYLSEATCPDCSTIHSSPGDLGQLALDYLAASGDRSFRGYDVLRHGLGVARYRCDLTAGDVAGTVSRVMEPHHHRLRAMVSAEAKAIYEEEGRPAQSDEKHWWLARDRCGIPADVHV